MKRISIWHVIFSSLFFVLAFFTILTFALSGFIADFNQMSRLVTQPKGVYFYIVIILLMLGIATNCFYLIRNFMGHLKYYWLFTGIILLIFCNLFYYELFIEQRIYFKFFSLEDSLKFSTEEIFQKRSHIIMTDYIFYTLFIAIPCLIGLLNLKFKKTTALGRFLNLTQPSFNLVIAGLFG
ncbi:MAG: hypothetical protein K2I63_01480, partial [Helicobacter sp.]|nr:hypothetical protein [Helicobacter sp.]